MFGRSTKAMRPLDELQRYEPTNELGFDFEDAQNRLLQVALDKPAKYYEMRKFVNDKVLKNITNFVYDLVSKLLYSGEVPRVDGTGFDQIELDGNPYVPGLPHSKVESEALKLTGAMAKQMQALINEILPKSHLDLAVRKQATLSNVQNNLV